MTRSLRKAAIVAVLLSIIVSTISPNSYSQGRLGRAPARDAEGTAPIPAGSSTIPAGTIIILEIDDKLSSGSSQVSDRFRAHVASPVVDSAGKTLIPVGIIVDGRVSSVSKAKWRHRSGILAIVFDNLRRPSGDPVPVRGTLTAAKAEDRKRLDEEAYLRGDSSLKRDIVFVGGGAGAGAVIGLVTGSMLVGAGVGAAAGLTAALLMKGKDVTVEPGERFGMVLSQPIASNLFQPNANPIPRPSPSPTPTPAPYIPPQQPYQPPAVTPTPQGPQPGPLNPFDATAVREGDGSVKLRVNAEAPSSGWRVFSNHENIANGVVRIRLRGTPPSNSSASSGYQPQLQQSATIPVPEICLEDRSGLLRRAEFMDKYGRSSFSVEIPYQPGNRYGRAPVSPSNGSGGAGSYQPPYVQPGSGGSQNPPSSSSVAALAKSAAGKIDVLRTQYAGTLQYFINPDGSTTFLGSQRPLPEQEQFFQGLMSLHASLVRLQNSSSESNVLRSNALRVQDDLNATNQVWNRVRLDASMNNGWRAAYTEINSLLNVAFR